MSIPVRQRPNRRFSCKFYTLGPTSESEPETDNQGQLVQAFSLVCRGLCALEKPRQPREIREGDRAVGEQEQILIASWTKTLASVSFGMYCFIPSLSKLYVVNGNATDPYGDRRYIHVYVADNVTADIRLLMPGATL